MRGVSNSGCTRLIVEGLYGIGKRECPEAAYRDRRRPHIVEPEARREGEDVRSISDKCDSHQLVGEGRPTDATEAVLDSE